MTIPNLSANADRPYDFKDLWSMRSIQALKKQ